MPNTLARRVLAGVGAAGAFVAVAALPASAAPTADLDVYVEDVTVAAGAPGVLNGPILWAAKETSLAGAVVEFDFADVAGLAEVVAQDDRGPDCTRPATHVLRCTSRLADSVGEGGLGGAYDVVFRAVGGSEGEGTVKTTFRLPGFTPIVVESRLRVGEGVDIAGGADTEVTSEPGGAFEAPLTFTNVGTTTVTNVNAIFYNDYAFQAARTFSNCTYVNGDQLRSCAFDVTIEPGETYRVGVPYRVRADTAAPGNAWGQISVSTRAQFEDYANHLASRKISLGTPGAGGVLTLAPAAGTKALRGAQADTEPSNDWSGVGVTVTGENRFDLVALGAKITGGVGDVADVELGLRDDGPAAIDRGRGGSPVTLVNVTVPPGTTAVAVSDDCAPLDGDRVDYRNAGKPGAAKYRCTPGYFIAPGEVIAFPFSLRIDRLDGAAGAVEINVACECDGNQSDTNAANDTAPITVEAGGAGGGGGGLPVTGPAAGVAAGAGALLLVAGGVGIVLARRRRTTFVS